MKKKNDTVHDTVDHILTMQMKIQNYRHARGLTIKALAEHWKLPFSTVRGWDQGEHAPRGAALLMVKQLLRR